MEQITIFQNGVLNKNLNKLTSLSEAIVTKVSPVTSAFFDVIYPEKDLHNGKSVVICPGGSYSFLSIDLEGTEVASWLVKFGYTVFVLGYSVPDQRSKALENLSELMQYLRQNSEDYKIQKDEIGLFGFSAGGHLCANYLLEKEKLNPTFEFVNPSFIVLIYPAYLDETIAEQTDANSIACPVFVFGTEDDPYVTSFYAYRGQLEKYNSKFKFDLFPKGGHGYGLRKGNTAAEYWPNAVEHWLKKIN